MFQTSQNSLQSYKTNTSYSETDNEFPEKNILRERLQFLVEPITAQIGLKLLSENENKINTITTEESGFIFS